MKNHIYNLINNWSKRKFDQKCEGHYTGIEIYSNNDAQGLFLQRDRSTKNLKYFRWSNRKINFGIMWRFESVRDKEGKYVHNSNGIVWKMVLNRWWVHFYFPPFTWIDKYKRYLKEKKEWKIKKAMLDSGEYTMDPMGAIHHIDDDQSEYYK